MKEYRKNYYKKNLDEIKENQQNNQIKTKESHKKYYRKIRSQKNPNYKPCYSWKSREESRKNFESVASLFHITDLSDWYRISITQINKSKGLFIY